MSVTDINEEAYKDPSEQRELRIHLLAKRRSEIIREQQQIENEIAKINRERS